jgi:tetratricopeptide (TPR) repeat protein
MLASAFITFTATNSWLERTTFNELFLLAGEKIGRFDPVILKNNLTILGTGQGFAYPATNSFTSLWIQQGILGFALVIFLLIFWFVVIARKYCKERRSSEGKIIFHALSGTLVMIIPSLFFDLTATFSVIYLGAVFIGAFQPFFVTNREVKTKVLIPLRAVVLAGVIFLVANQWKSALEIHYAYLGDRYLSLGKSLAARECFEKALKISPNNGDYYHKLALVAEQMGDDNLALDYVRQALNLNPREKELYALAGNLYLKQGDLEEADKYYLKITDAYEFYFLRYENLAASFLAKAQDLIKKGQREEAEEYFYKIQEIYSKMEEAYQRARERENKENQFEVSPRMKLIMSKCYYYLRDYDQSEKWAREAMQYPETRSSGIEILYFIRDQLEAGN